MKATLPDIDDPLLKYLRRKKMTSPTFTTPGASLDYLNGNPNRMIEYFIDMPAKRVKVLVRSTKIGFFESKCENAGFDSEWDGLNPGHSFWYATLFQGRESRDAEDELDEAIDSLTGYWKDCEDVVSEVRMKDALKNFANAIIAARK